MNNSYSILINTCDKFEDCWSPFFKLWNTYWSDCKGKIYLNTEYKDFSYEGLDIIPVKGCERNGLLKLKRATWSQCLRWALDTIETDIILYMQEDYFIRDIVKNEIIEEYVHLMANHEETTCIHLTDQAVKTNGKSTFKNLDNVNFDQRYRVSCQAALWRKSELLSLIRDYEDAWEFEEFGSMRSAVMKHSYYAVNRSFVKLNQFEIIPYIFTGIVQGRWYEEVVPLFKKHNIEMDFSIRGFLQDAPPKALRKRIHYRLNKIPKIVRNQIDLYSMKKGND